MCITKVLNDDNLSRVTNCKSAIKVWMLAQRPITLVLMIINSCSYNTNDLVFNKFQIFIKILVGV